MSCANPVTINVKGRAVQVGCRHCLNCRLEYQIALEFGVRHELFDMYQRGLGACFCTLTYDDNHLPAHGSLCKKDLQNFFKLVRTNQKRKNPLPQWKYLACGEYGDSFGRPHYHVLFLGLTDTLAHNFVVPYWEHGLTDCKVLKSGAIRYVLKYCTKTAMGTKAEELYDNQNLERPFITHSKKLGYDWLLRNRDDIVAHNFCYMDKGIRKPLPAYWRRQFDLFDQFDPTPSIKKLSHEAKQHGYPDYQSWSKQKTYNFEREMTAKVRESGIPVDDSSLIYESGYVPFDVSLVKSVLSRS
ncbi:replication initiation protein [Tortoise microvirus 80]|nr:replication initiation protein [Tortoise microvirus 80]